MRILSCTTSLALLAACRAGAPAPSTLAIPAHGVIGVDSAQLEPAFWVRQQAQPDRIIMTTSAIANQNRVMLERDPSLFDLDRLSDPLPGDLARRWVSGLSRAPGRQLYDEHGDSVSADRIAALVAAAQVEAIPDVQPLRFALVTERADLRTFPTRLRVFSSLGNTDIDRWQESAIFPGTPVVIVHASRDGQWWFVVSRHYAAWIEKTHVAEGPRELVLGYERKTPYLVVTGASVRTVFTPEQPAVSELRLEMGVRVPVLADWPPSRPVNGQNPYTGTVIELPVRTDAGTLQLVPALLPRTADVARDYLPLTPAALIAQSFKFLGERYGWGHGYQGRDCSGFVSEVYRAFGVDLPRNTGDQAVSPALNRLAFTAADSREARLAALRDAQVGDLVYIPGHVMMVIGHYRGVPYVIHDVVGITYRGGDGDLVRVPLNEVSVTPLTPLASSAEQLFVDRITSIQRVRP
jgi:SH3 domain containing protein/NlpC/P60 family protein